MGLRQSLLLRPRRRAHLQDPCACHQYHEAGLDVEKGSEPIWDFTDDRLHPALNWVLKLALKALCLISFGHPDLQTLNYLCQAPRSAWQDSNDRLYERLNTIVVVAGLLLGSTGAFISTPPPLPGTLNYNERGPYICLFVSWGLSLGTLIVGSTIMFVVSKCDPIWFKRTHMRSRSRIVFTMWLVGFPFISMGASTLMAALGLLAAAWTSADPLVLKGAAWLLLIPASCIPLFIWTQYKPGTEDGQIVTSVSSRSPAMTPPNGSQTQLLPPNSTPISVEVPISSNNQSRIVVYLIVQPFSATAEHPTT